MKKILLLLALISIMPLVNAQNLELRDAKDYAVDLSDIWGWSDGEKEYALIGLINAFTVADVTDPDNIVKLFNATVDGPLSFWRDIKTFGHYAYGVHDGPFSGVSQGLVIMDLQYLPDSMPATFWTDEGSFTEAHNIYIDENGIAYLVGHDHGGSGVLMLDIATDPLNPAIIGQYTDGYVHDCYVRNDTLWTSDGNKSFGSPGQKRFSVVDVSDKANPALLGYGATPGGYSHNIWVSDDGKTAFTTDESSGAYITSHDVSDPTDIQELDRWRSNPGSNVIPHNVTVVNDFLVISYYRDGVIIVDASLPDELVKVGQYDTAPASGSGFNGCWGVYPYLPSGTILAADIELGLHVLTPNYKRAVHIRGDVTDASSGNVITGASVEIILGSDTTDLVTGLEGKFKKGYPNGGIFTIRVSKEGYTTYSDTRVLTNADILELDIALTSLNYLGNFVWDDLNENGFQDIGEPGIAGVQVKLLSDNGAEVDTDISDENGLFGFIDINAGDYALQFLPPQDGMTLYIATTTDAGDDEIDNDVALIDNVYKTNVFSLTNTGSFLSFDGGFFKREVTDPVDTIEVVLAPLESITVCDEALENNLINANESSVCSVTGDLAGSTYDVETTGCLSFNSGNQETGPIEICVITTNTETGQMDTTIFIVSVQSVISANTDAFEKGELSILQNPVSTILYMKNHSQFSEELRIMVSDLSGRQMKQVTDDGINHLISVHVDDLNRGMYIISVFTDYELLGVSRFIKH